MSYLSEIKKERVGEIFYNKDGKKMQIVNYENSRRATVLFDSGYSTTKRYVLITKGLVKDKGSHFTSPLLQLI